MSKDDSEFTQGQFEGMAYMLYRSAARPAKSLVLMLHGCGQEPSTAGTYADHLGPNASAKMLKFFKHHSSNVGLSLMGSLKCEEDDS